MASSNLEFLGIHGKKPKYDYSDVEKEIASIGNGPICDKAVAIWRNMSQYTEYFDQIAHKMILDHFYEHGSVPKNDQIISYKAYMESNNQATLYTDIVTRVSEFRACMEAFAKHELQITLQNKHELIAELDDATAWNTLDNVEIPNYKSAEGIALKKKREFDESYKKYQNLLSKTPDAHKSLNEQLDKLVVLLRDLKPMLEVLAYRNEKQNAVEAVSKLEKLLGAQEKLLSLIIYEKAIRTRMKEWSNFTAEQRLAETEQKKGPNLGFATIPLWFDPTIEPAQFRENLRSNQGSGLKYICLDYFRGTTTSVAGAALLYGDKVRTFLNEIFHNMVDIPEAVYAEQGSFIVQNNATLADLCKDADLSLLFSTITPITFTETTFKNLQSSIKALTKAIETLSKEEIDLLAYECKNLRKHLKEISTVEEDISAGKAQEKSTKRKNIEKLVDTLSKKYFPKILELKINPFNEAQTEVVHTAISELKRIVEGGITDENLEQAAEHIIKAINIIFKYTKATDINMIFVSEVNALIKKHKERFALEVALSPERSIFTAGFNTTERSILGPQGTLTDEAIDLVAKVQEAAYNALLEKNNARAQKVDNSVEADDAASSVISINVTA